MIPATSPVPSEAPPTPTRASLWASRLPLPLPPSSPAAGGSRTAAFDARISLLITHPCADDVLVMEYRYGIRATGPTREDALAAFWRAFDRRGKELEAALDQAVQAGLGYPQKPELMAMQREASYIQAVQEWERRLQEAKAEREEARRLLREGTTLDVGKERTSCVSTSHE